MNEEDRARGRVGRQRDRGREGEREGRISRKRGEERERE